MTAAAAAPATPEKKRPLDAKADPGTTKKMKSTAGYKLNANFALDKGKEVSSFKAVIKMPPSALKGLAAGADPMLKNFKVSTIEDLANLKFYKIAKAIKTMAEVEEDGKRHEKSMMNFNDAVDKAWEKKTFKEMLKAPIGAIQGIGPKLTEHLAKAKITKVEQLADWKFCRWSEALVTMAKYETADFASKA